MAECVRSCAVHGGKLVKNLDWKKGQLAEAIRELLARYAAAMTDPGDAAALSGGKSTWPKSNPEVFDALLEVGNKAVDVRGADELRLATRITETIFGVRKQSRAGWRLRARLMDALGDDAATIAAYERFLALTPNDDLNVAGRITKLRESGERLAETLELLQQEAPGAREFKGAPDTELWAEGLALKEAGDWERAEPRLVAALVSMAEQDRPSTSVRAALTDYVNLRLERDHGRLAGSTRLLELYADDRRLRELDPIADPGLTGTEMVALSDFRNLIAGRTICLVANSQRVGTSAMGQEIDSYDLVVRFNSYRIEAPATGTKTDIHATIHLHNYNWDKKVETRLVFSGSHHQWRNSVRRRLVPGAQRYVGDRTLRWPVREIGRVGEDVMPSIPTSGFNMLWLLDFLDVSPKIDLIGFDFYDSGAYRLQEAMKLPIATAHGYSDEKAWVMARAQEVTEMRISLR
ncbi:hypothetical protein [Actinacidiphila glaucinigra]|uniref:hypothetical protein n=1 Tax=Actinacidiphila glaucinigra TaxID=235986 RepID=UPI002E36C777|nr:hypothetical protein [Actinacidiphila glaucinigra]